MSKLVVFSNLELGLDGKSSAHVACTFGDEVKFSRRIGDTVLIASTGTGLSDDYVGLGTLGRFSYDAAGTTFVLIDNIVLFPQSVSLIESLRADRSIVEISDETFDRIIAQTMRSDREPSESDQAPAPISRDQFLPQLQRQQQSRCTFSGVKTTEGKTFIIKTFEAEGRLHASNHLFLHPEPGRLFSEFAWSVGPKFEILINVHAMGGEVASTVHPLGMLALPRRPEVWPDRDALAWHRQQFLARIES